MKKNISSKLKDKKLGNKTSEEFEEEKDENYMTDNENILSNAKYRAIPYMHKNTNVKILENLDENDEENYKKQLKNIKKREKAIFM